MIVPCVPSSPCSEGTCKSRPSPFEHSCTVCIHMQPRVVGPWLTIFCTLLAYRPIVIALGGAQIASPRLPGANSHIPLIRLDLKPHNENTNCYLCYYVIEWNDVESHWKLVEHPWEFRSNSSENQIKPMNDLTALINTDTRDGDNSTSLNISRDSLLNTVSTCEHYILCAHHRPMNSLK